MDDHTASDLTDWITQRDEAAFCRLVERHNAMVVGVCRRRLGDGEAAGEAAQAVFIILARRAKAVANPLALEAWLHGVAVGVCRNARRAAHRRAHHEQEAAILTAAHQRDAGPGQSGWAELRPHLDDALSALNASERELVIGHFLRGLPQVAVAEHLGISKSATSKRLANALGKLRVWFSKRGVSVGAGVLVAGMASEIRASEPALTAACAQAGLHPAGAAGAAKLAGSVAAAAVAKLMAVAVASVLVVGTAGVVIAQRTMPGNVPAAPTALPSAAEPARQELHAPTYHARWRNGLPSAADFFPIGVWLQNPADAEAYKRAGINLYIGLWEGPTEAQLSGLATAGMMTICEQNEVGLRHLDDRTIVSWLAPSNPDDAQARGDGSYGPPVDAAAIEQAYDAIRAADDSRPVCLLLDQGVAWDDYPGRGVRRNHPEDYPAYLQGGDILNFHIHPVNQADPAISGNLWYVPFGVDRLRTWSADAKPVWPMIECTRIDAASVAKPTPEQVRAQVWMSLIHGANGLIYFCHDLNASSADSAALLHDQAMLQAVTAINRQIAALAPVLNSPSLSAYANVDSSDRAVPVDLLVKRSGDATYLFAVAMRDGATTATFTVPAGDEVEVLGEDRSLSVRAGTFTDRFQPYAVHLYKIADGKTQR